MVDNYRYLITFLFLHFMVFFPLTISFFQRRWRESRLVVIDRKVFWVWPRYKSRYFNTSKGKNLRITSISVLISTKWHNWMTWIGSALLRKSGTRSVSRTNARYILPPQYEARTKVLYRVARRVLPSFPQNDSSKCLHHACFYRFFIWNVCVVMLFFVAVRKRGRRHYAVRKLFKSSIR